VNFYGIRVKDRGKHFKVIIYSEPLSETLYDFLGSKDEQKKLKNKKTKKDVDRKLKDIYL
jgi:hypothetical protein